MLLYTSGSTGTPKGAMYSERLVAEMWGGEGWSEFFAEGIAIANFHSMPMSHGERPRCRRSTRAREDMESLLGIELHELYGTTEIGGVPADGKFLSPPVIDYRLHDVPELGHLTSDRPDARGELLVKVRIIDRKNAIIKLSQGEFVALPSLEAA